MSLTLGISPCPNDTFIFDALVNNKIDVEGLEFDIVFADVEQLNRWAFEGKLDITKLSFNAFANTPRSTGKYKNWESFVAETEKGKICFAQTVPTKRAPGAIKRDQSKLFVTYSYRIGTTCFAISP